MKANVTGGQRIALRVNGVVRWLATDHLGSTALTASETGGRLSEIRYKPWGESRYTFGATPTQRRFTGQVLDEVAGGLYFYNARYYDPALGRFTQADTLIPNPGNPQSLNRYAYAANNPTGYVDPTGHAQVCGSDVDGGCGGSDALHTIETYLMQGRYRWGYLEARLAYYQYYLAHPNASAPEFYQPLTRNPAAAQELKGVMSLAYVHAQSEMGAPNTAGVMLGAATDSGLAAESLSDVGANVAFGMGIYAAGVAGRSVGFGGGVLVEDEEIVVFESARGSSKIKTHDPEGQSAQSLAVAGSPEQAYQGAFGRSPSSGEPYWQTTAGQIAATGRFAYLDAAGSPGHVSIYGGSYRNPVEFVKIWTRRIFGP